MSKDDIVYRSHLSVQRDAGNKPFVNQIELYKAGKDGPWPSDVQAYYDKLDHALGVPKAKLCLGYGWTWKFWEENGGKR